jgi:SAM-dependent methyltransferase
MRYCFHAGAVACLEVGCSVASPGSDSEAGAVRLLVAGARAAGRQRLPSAKLGSLARAPSTRGSDYTDRLVRLGERRWKRLVGVQAPYRWNARRLLGGRDVLDVGCGIGRNLVHLTPRGVGVDHNEHSIALCRERGLTAFTTAEFPHSEHARPERFGGLLMAHVVEHMTHAEAIAVLGAYLPYLTADARVVLICPQERGFDSDRTHVEFADLDALADISTALGLVEQRRFSFPLPRAAGRLFTHNEFVLVAGPTRADA